MLNHLIIDKIILVDVRDHVIDLLNRIESYKLMSYQKSDKHGRNITIKCMQPTKELAIH